MIHWHKCCKTAAKWTIAAFALHFILDIAVLVWLVTLVL